MSDITAQSPLLTEAEQETILSQLFGELQRLNGRMRNDQADIDRLMIETRAISIHSDQLLLQIEAQLEALRMAS